MDQIAIGHFITKKRKEQNITQEQLAERLGVSNKTVSKWETGKCMPDYAAIEPLCHELHITLAELLDGAEVEKSIHGQDTRQILEMLEKRQALKNKKRMLIGIVLFFSGTALLICSRSIGGTDIQEALSGFALGLSFPQMLLGIVLAAWPKGTNQKGRGL